MRPYIAASICASAVAGVIALIAAIEAIDRSQRGYQSSDSLLVEALATGGFYFILVFILVAKFPAWPTRGLLVIKSTFTLSNLRTPVQRLCFIVMCVGVLVWVVTSATYYLNGHEQMFEYWLGGQGWAPGSYRLWLWVSILASGIGLCGSFLYDAVIKPVAQWVRGERANELDK